MPGVHSSISVTSVPICRSPSDLYSGSITVISRTKCDGNYLRPPFLTSGFFLLCHRTSVRFSISFSGSLSRANNEFKGIGDSELTDRSDFPSKYKSLKFC